MNLQLRSSLYGAFSTVLRPPILTVYALLWVIGLSVLSARHLSSLVPPPYHGSSAKTGDFSAFWTGTSVIGMGQGSQLYDFELQRHFQQVIHGADSIFLPYMNPPALAIALLPFHSWGFLPTYASYIVGQLFVFSLACWALRSQLHPVLSRSLTAPLLLLGFLPFWRSGMGHQNAMLTMSLLAFLYVGMRKNSPILSGLALGMLTYKPQFVPVFAGMFLLQREWKVLGVASLVGGLHWLIGAYYCGLDWPVRMMRAVFDFQLSEGVIDLHGAGELSLIGASDWMGFPTLGRFAAVALVVVTVLTTYKAAARTAHFSAAFASWVLLSLLVSPHTQYYECSLAIFSVILLIDGMLKQGKTVPLLARLVFATAYLSYPLHDFSGLMGFQPLILSLLVFYAVALYRAYFDEGHSGFAT